MAFTKVIDFFEYSFLLEACIPPVPIARYMFFEQSFKDYDNMSQNERNKLYTWMMKSDLMKNPRDSMLSYDKIRIEKWKARYNPDNQYVVHWEYQSLTGEDKCFLYDEEYWTGINTRIMQKHITKIEKL